MTPGERLQTAKQKGLCFNCLSRNHLISDCKSRNCATCNRRHHTLLHMESKNKANSNNVDTEGAIKSCHVVDSSMVLLSTARADVVDFSGKRCDCRVLLDSGSQPNLMTEAMANRLNLRKRRLQSAIEALNGNKINSAEWVETILKSRTSNFSARLSFLILPSITSEIPSIPVNKDLFNMPSHIQLADPDFHRPAAVDMLLGA